ncbi:MAG: CAP domain-containing protein [Spirochaetales bacterium]|nr:CAP domain-containing protein [Spirochaetales bacterium]
MTTKTGFILLVLMAFATSAFTQEKTNRIESILENVHNWDMGQLDTARSVGYLSDAEKDVVLYVNKLRTNPSAFADQYLIPRRAHYSGKIYAAPGKMRMMTSEGVKALDECIRILKATKPLEPLSPSAALSAASTDHVRDTGPKGILGHNGSNGSTLESRISRHGKWDILIGENIAYGYADGLDIVVQLVVDDGVRSRGHRKNLLFE